MNNLELKVNQEVGLLNWNFAELDAQLDAQLKKYDGLQFTDQEIPEAKKTRAALNNVAKEINARKISVKKQFCQPYEDFAEQAKKLIAKIDSCNSGIDAQIKAYEQTQKDAKLKEIEAYWQANKPTFTHENVKRVLNEKWLNASCTQADWKNQLQIVIDRINSDTDTIAKFEPNEMNFCLEDYLKTLDISVTLQNWQRHIDDAKRAEEAKAQMEANRLAREEAQKAEEAKAQMEANRLAREEAQKANEADLAQSQAEAKDVAQAAQKQLTASDYLYSPTFKVIDASYDQMIALMDYMKSAKISVESIAKEKREK
jgi:hypothetical protein